jgi:hypothetical protein
MSVWHQHALADAHQTELRQQADHHLLVAACRPAKTAPRGASIGRVQQRLGMLLVETGLHLITRTGDPEQTGLSHTAAGPGRR